MPSFLKKKRHSTANVASGEEHSPLSQGSIPLPSTPPRKAHNRSFSTESTPSLRRRISSISSSPSHLKTAVKKQIQRLDDALRNVTLLPARPGRAHAVHSKTSGKLRDRPAKARSPSEGLVALSSSIAVVHAFPSFHSSSSSQSSTASVRHRTLSSPKDEDLHYEKLYRSIEQRTRPRTTSCPNVLPFEHKKMSSEPAEGLLTVSEEASRGGVGQERKPLALPEVYVEPEVPDPFLVDDEGDALSEEDRGGASVSEGTQAVSPAAADSVPLSISPSPAPLSAKPLPSPFLSPDVNKEVPPPPISDAVEQSEEEAPELSVPALVLPTMFLPIPNTDPLTTLLNKYIYPPEQRPMRDVSGEWQNSDFHTLVMTNSWRALARMARDRIVAADPEDLNLILGLWHLRLSCLARLRLFNQTAAECTNLFSVLTAVEPPESRAYLFSYVLPFELEVMQTKLKYWNGDHMGYLDALSALLTKCKLKARDAGRNGDETNASMWKERGSRIVLIIASQMVEMKEYTAAARLLEPLCVQKGGVTNPTLRSAIARIYLQSGNLPAAAKHLEIVDQDPRADERQKRINAALLASARGEWGATVKVLKEMIEKDSEDYAAVNNLSVALLSQGKLKESVEVMESALKASPSSVVVAEPFLFNLTTLYELRSMYGSEKKRQLLVEVAKWSGDGLKTSCLKMPAN